MTEMISSYAGELEPASSPRWLGMLRRSFVERLQHLQGGAILLCEAGREPLILGERIAGVATLRVDIASPEFYRHACLGGSVGLGEAYMLDLWHSDHLVEVTRLLMRNLEQFEALDGGLAKLKLPLLKFFEWRHRNHRRGSRLNIAAHYDLGNEFFKLFLDPGLTYSSGMFNSAADTLEDAQFNKLDAICRKLQFAPGERVIEIGSGWGSFALHAAGRYGVHVTTTTLSREQHALATQRVREAGLQDRVQVLLSDYRELQGRFDKLVSVEMVEAVGHEFLPDYLKTCERLLLPHGQALIQAITCADQRYDAYRKSSDFIRRYIFPGGLLPSATHLLTVATQHTGLRLFHFEDFSDGYARTLAEWRRRFQLQLGAVRAQGYGEPFVRMWDFYLATCEAAFAEHYTGVTHLLFTGAQCRRAPVPA